MGEDLEKLTDDELRKKAWEKPPRITGQEKLEVCPMGQPIWEKQLDDMFTLFEYPKESNSLNCIIQCNGRGKITIFAFDSWGGERESIMAEHCMLCCLVMGTHGVNVSTKSFGWNLEYALNEVNSEDEDEDDDV